MRKLSNESFYLIPVTFPFFLSPYSMHTEFRAMRNVTTRNMLLVLGSILAAAVLYSGAKSFIVRDSSRTPGPRAANLPNRLTDPEFWRMVSDFSEPNGYFQSDNFLSNERGYQEVIPRVRRTVQPGGVYVGVGPEQNFTYIVGLEPKMAFIVDIRRQNLLEHLLYKSLMELSADRADFIGLLFSRPRPSGLTVDSPPETLFQSYRASEPSTGLFHRNLQRVLDHLEQTHGFALSSDDERSVQKVYDAFFEAGPDLSYVFLGGFSSRWGMPTYEDLMEDSDGAGKNWSFLATDKQFQTVRQLQKDNLIVPLVGDFGGKNAIRSVGRYLKDRDALVTTFYTSNVEQYLFQDDKSDAFYANVATLPIDSTSTFIRFVLNGRGGLTRRFLGYRSRTSINRIQDVLKAFRAGKIRYYLDVVDMSQ
jgi:hypothetical protein